MSRLYLLALGVGVGAYLFLPSTAVQSIVFDAIGLTAAIAILGVTVMRRREPQLGWFLIGLGILLMSVGDIVFGEAQGVPSIADMFYISAYPLLALGIAALTPWWATKRREPSVPLALGLTVVVGAFAWAFLILPSGVLHDAQVISKVVSWGYPVLDVVLIGLLIRAGLPERFGDRAMIVLFGGLGLWMAADVTYALQDFGNGYELGNWSDLLWLLAYTLFGAALLVSPEPEVEEDDTPEWESSSGGVGVLTRLEAPSLRLGVVVSMSGRMLLLLGASAICLGGAWSAVNLVLLGGALGMSGSFMWMAGARA